MAREQAQGFVRDVFGRETGMREPGEGALDAAARRLDRAVGELEARLMRRSEQDERGAQAALGAAAFDTDRAALAAELDASRARERALEGIAAEASAALGRAAAEVRAALAGAEGEEPPKTADPAEVMAGDVAADGAADESALSEGAGANAEAALDADLFAPIPSDRSV